MLLLVFILLISLVFFARKQVVTYSINNYLLAHKAQLSCIDFSLTTAFDIIISKVCINAPQADIELENVSLQLQLSATLPVRAINVAAMRIQGKAKLLEQSDSDQQAFAENSVKHYLSTIAQLTLPLPITIKAFTYQPFSLVNNSNNSVFYGQFVANKNNISVSLKDSKQANIISVILSPKEQNFTAKLNADLAPLKQFLAIHQLTLPAKLNKKIIIKGKLTTQLQWHEETLTATSQLEHFSIDSAIGITKRGIAKSGVAQNGSFNINGMLSWQSNITASQALFVIDEQSVVNIDFSEQKLHEFLVRKKLPTNIIVAIKDNPSKGLVIKPQGKMQIDFAKQQVFLANIELASNNKTKPLQLAFTETYLAYDETLNFILKQSNYAAKAKFRVSRLNKLSKQLVNIASTGTLKQHEKQNGLGWQVTFSPATTLELSMLELSSSPLHSAKTNSTANRINKNALSIKKLTTHWQGNIYIDNHGQTELSLQLNSQASSLQIKDIAQITQTELQADISGTLQDINITASLTADNQLLANIKLSGIINKPQLELFAQNVDITELLALKLNLPIELSLVDGHISYHLQGQLTDIDNWLNNAAKLDVSIQDVSGEVENIWLQELNWQQKFLLSDGYIKSINLDKKPINNLTIAKIEIAPPLTEFSAQTALSFKNKASSFTATQLNAKTLGGSVNIAQVQWPFTASRSVNVQLISIDLEKLLELDPKQGIIVTGKISGSLPVVLNDKQFTIAGGELHNVGDGIIKVANNPTVEELKANDLQLKLAFDAMQNIHYHQLSSDVSMANDGYMLFDTVIKGRNPDLDNDVNLNLNLSYDLFGLLKSLNISNNLEQTLIDSLQKN